MSLIDDALKRAQAAQAEPNPESRPWTPPPLPDPRRTAPRPARWILVLGSATLLAVAALLFWRLGRPAKPALRSTAAKVPALASGLPPITSEVAVAPPPGRLAPPAVARSHADLAPSGATTGQGSPATSSAPPASRLAAPSAPRAEARDTRPHPPGAEPRSYASEMPLLGGAKITLDGIVFSEASPVAVLNGRVLPVGGFVEGYTVVKILPDRVELEADGARAILTLR